MSKNLTITVYLDSEHQEWIVKNQNGTTLRRCSGQEQALAFAEQHRRKGKDVHLLESECKTVLPGITPRRIALEREG